MSVHIIKEPGKAYCGRSLDFPKFQGPVSRSVFDFVEFKTDPSWRVHNFNQVGEPCERCLEAYNKNPIQCEVNGKSVDMKIIPDPKFPNRDDRFVFDHDYIFEIKLKLKGDSK